MSRTPTTLDPMSSPDELAASWSRMRTDRPALSAHLVGDRFRLWSDTRAESDALLGPADLELFLAEDRARTGARLSPGVVAGDNSRMAFTWDATFPDGTVLTGIDVNTLDADGCIATTWSVTGERANTLSVLDPPAPVARDVMNQGCADWTTMWNGEVERVHDLVTDDFRIWFGTHRSADDSIRGPAAMRTYVDRFRAQLPGVRFAEHSEFVLDTARGRAALTWTVTLPGRGAPDNPPTGQPADLNLGGIDLFQFTDNRIAQVWSITGIRAHTL